MENVSYFNIIESNNLYTCYQRVDDVLDVNDNFVTSEVMEELVAQANKPGSGFKLIEKLSYMYYAQQNLDKTADTVIVNINACNRIIREAIDNAPKRNKSIKVPPEVQMLIQRFHICYPDNLMLNQTISEHFYNGRIYFKPIKEPEYKPRKPSPKNKITYRHWELYASCSVKYFFRKYKVMVKFPRLKKDRSPFARFVKDSTLKWELFDFIEKQPEVKKEDLKFMRRFWQDPAIIEIMQTKKVEI